MNTPVEETCAQRKEGIRQLASNCTEQRSQDNNLPKPCLLVVQTLRLPGKLPLLTLRCRPRGSVVGVGATFMFAVSGLSLRSEILSFIAETPRSFDRVRQTLSESDDRETQSKTWLCDPLRLLRPRVVDSSQIQMMKNTR